MLCQGLVLPIDIVVWWDNTLYQFEKIRPFCVSLWDSRNANQFWLVIRQLAEQFLDFFVPGPAHMGKYRLAKKWESPIKSCRNWGSSKKKLVAVLALVGIRNLVPGQAKVIVFYVHIMLGGIAKALNFLLGQFPYGTRRSAPVQMT